MSHMMDGLRPAALHSCVLGGNLEMARLLIQHGVNLSPVNDFGRTPMHYAVCLEDSSETSVGLLVDAGADMSASTAVRDTILSMATRYGTPSMVQLRLRRGTIPTT
jgi:ankyrin repeat protein